MIASTAEPGQSVRALLVEDEALVAMFAEEVLSSLGFEPTIARTGAEARDHWARFTPDLAVIDVGLPDMRGDKLAQELRARLPKLPILMASGYDVADLRETFKGDAHTGFLPKPYTEDDIVKAARGLGFDLKDA